MLTLGKRLAELREGRGESLQEVADAVGVSKAHIWQLEKEKAANPALNLVERLASHFHVSVGELVGEDTNGQLVDPVLAGLFREAQKFSPEHRQLLIDFVQSLIRIRQSQDAQRLKAMAKALANPDY